MSDKKIPNGYFDQLPDKMLQKFSEEEQYRELQDLTKLLATMPKDNPYHVPQNYFEKLTESTSKKLRPKSRKLWILISTVAACLIIIMMVMPGMTDNNEDLSEIELLDYYAENVEELDTDVLSELVYVDMLDDEQVIDDEEMQEIISSLTDYELELFHKTF
jgi:argininosuccinate lyase